MRAEINVLGPLRVLVDGVSVVPTASKPRQLLAMLAINASRVVTTSALMDELWGNSTPRSAAGTLQTYILHVRRLIRAALPPEEQGEALKVLATTPTGYVLRVDPEVVDAVRYARLASAGRLAGETGDYVAAERLLTSALALWRGPALVDVPVGRQMEIEAMRLGESRLTDLTMRIDADLRLGRHHQLLGDLAALCARHPYMENFRAQYMLALYRSGRPGQALEAYQEMRTTIRDHLGVDPSRTLRELHRAILAGDAALDQPGYLAKAPGALAG
jgi:SARP family transcriptional regulator, regulator of embCAB operon